MVSRVLQWFPLATWPDAKNSLMRGVVGLAVPLEKATPKTDRFQRVENDILCRNQHGCERAKVMGYAYALAPAITLTTL